MIDKILAIKRDTSFDFRQFAFPDDPLKHLFEEWIDYYRMKYAACKAIAPNNILEIGVRYGYSAISFLSACGEATYLGIDSNTATYGGAVGAIEWARKILKPFKADFLIADTQAMISLPGEFYDLIHIDGQQDGDGTFHDLELAIEKGRYLLLDGYFWSRENMLSSAFFLEKYKNLVEYALLIPGYAGDLLIKTKPEANEVFGSSRARDYSTLKKKYDETYYLKDCEGYEAFKKNRGIELENLRLATVFYLTNPERGQAILDIGCGRGELSFALARSGATVTAVDYSMDSIRIAQSVIQEAQREGINTNLTFSEGDFLQIPFNKRFDRIVAADFIEHIDQDSLEKMIQRIAGLLREGGRLILHTCPSKLYYKYAYEKKRRVAKNIGIYLPKNPRSYYEDLMHLNEQTPAHINRLLKKYFKCVHTWVSSFPDLVGSLNRPITKEEIARASSIFAVASEAPIDKGEILSLITQEKLEAANVDVELRFLDRQLEMRASSETQVTISVLNKGRNRFVSIPPYPMCLSYHWLNTQGTCEIFEGVRSLIIVPLQPSEEREFRMRVIAPEKTGDYLLQGTMVQELVFWLENIKPTAPITIPVRVI